MTFLVQTDRLVRLRTSLGPDVLVAEHLEVDEAIGPAWTGTGACAGAGAQPGGTAGSRIVVTAVSESVYVDVGQLQGTPVLVELLTQQSRIALRPWHGLVSAVSQLGSDGGLARYRLTVEPWFAFLAHQYGGWKFQNQTVRQIVDGVFRRYEDQGMLKPQCRWELADPDVYLERSVCSQYGESDLQFVQRLLRREGLFHWFEHGAASSGGDFGTHVLVIADHNGAFVTDIQPLVRYTQSHMALGEDSITQWTRGVRVHASGLLLSSRDYRGLDLRAVAQGGSDNVSAEGAPFAANGRPDARPALDPRLAVTDVPGTYAYASVADGERLALRQMQAIDAQREEITALSSVRTSAPARVFTLADHPLHDGSDPVRDRFVVLRARHRARSNLGTELQTRVDSSLGPLASSQPKMPANDMDEPVYSCRLHVQRASVPVRMAFRDERGEPDVRLHPAPRVHGMQTAVVVGFEAPVHADRDHRIKVQDHWQRGSQASHGLGSAGADNAPASDASGTWVRVAESVAGEDWGSHFIPRLGQEVLVAFLDADIDRGVVVGSVYNGQGASNGVGNVVAGGAARTTGNAPAWFPGDAPQGRLQGHGHAAVLGGFKSQELGSSQFGTGGANEFVFDDTPQESRIELATTAAATSLQLGHLLHQRGNERLQPLGFGACLDTTRWGAVRGGAALLISADGQPGSLQGGKSLNSTEPLQRIGKAGELVRSLAWSAQQQHAKLPREADLVVSDPSNPRRQFPAWRALGATYESLASTDEASVAHHLSAEDARPGIGGGAGAVPAWRRPDLVIAAPGGIGSFTPESSFYTAGEGAAFVAQDLHQLAQGAHVTAVAQGLVLYTLGKAADAQRPNAETGLRLHAASGSVSLESQTGKVGLVADRKVVVASTTAKVRITAPLHLLFTAAGAALRIEPNAITLVGPGKIEFKAAKKELAGPATAESDTQLRRPGRLAICQYRLSSAAKNGDAFLPV